MNETAEKRTPPCRRFTGSIVLSETQINIDCTAADQADRMMNSTGKPNHRVLSWLPLFAALSLLTGCAHLTAPPPMQNQSAGLPPTVTPTTAAVAHANHQVASPGPANSSVQQAGATVIGPPQPPYVARQFPDNTPPAALGLPPGAQVVPGTAGPFGPPLPELGGVGAVDPYAPVTPLVPYQGPRVREADLIINGFPARTGRIMLGGAVNSDAGLTGQLTIDERNFDIMRWPRSFRDLFSGNALRGAGQTFRIEAAPGTDFKRYTIQFADPNLFGYKPVSMSVSGFLFDRRYQDWDEERLGGRLAFGYRITPDLSVSAGVTGQNVNIDPSPSTVDPRITDVAGDNEMYSGEVSLMHDTRNSPIQASEGHYFELKFEEVFGKFEYARFELEYRKYWLVAQRADDSGKQTISYSTQVGFSGNDTPVFENFFAGGYATIRGFEFRGASPVGIGGEEVGGQFQWLNTVEYMFPITADDAFRGVAFVDFGTVEQTAKLDADTYRVAPGLGVRVAIPMLGPAPLAFDFAYPVTKAPTDQERIFSFYMSLIR
jgi:outer membrane protein insertion porin family